jgi:hypothetical protein
VFAINSHHFSSRHLVTDALQHNLKLFSFENPALATRLQTNVKLEYLALLLLLQGRSGSNVYT